MYSVLQFSFFSMLKIFKIIRKAGKAVGRSLYTLSMNLIQHTAKHTNNLKNEENHKSTVVETNMNESLAKNKRTVYTSKTKPNTVIQGGQILTVL